MKFRRWLSGFFDRAGWEEVYSFIRYGHVNIYQIDDCDPNFPCRLTHTCRNCGRK